MVDLDRDGKQEIVFSRVIQDTVASNETTIVWADTSRIFALRHDGTIVPGWPVVLCHGRFLVTPGDYDDDSLPELFVRYDKYIFLGPTGEIECSFDKIPFGHIMYSGWRGAADTDGDGRAELIFSGVQFIGYESSTDDTGALGPYTVGLLSVDCLGREVWRIRIGSNLPTKSLYRPYSSGLPLHRLSRMLMGTGFLSSRTILKKCSVRDATTIIISISTPGRFRK